MPADSREKILRRIREALTVPAPARHLPGKGDTAAHAPREWLPPVPQTRSDLAGLFEKNSRDLKTDLRRCADRAAASATLSVIAREEGWKSVATHDFSLGSAAVPALGLPVLRTDVAYETAALEACDAGISGCECLVAQTGGILVTSASAGGRALSVLPPHHVVIATESQLVGDLVDAFSLLRARYPEIPSFLSFITGPSRTGDIERILVLGAHGPKKLTVLLVAE
jgi:L-lactate dehydrogenase complex protein LldG